jgi:hypothetical protein
MPRGYDHIQQPPVLMVLPGEVGKNIAYKGTTPELRAANFALRLSGISSQLPLRSLTRQYEIPDGDAWVNHTTLVATPHDSPANNREFFIPRLVYVGAKVEPDLLGTSLAHETDHWDFFFDEGPRIQANPGQQLTGKQMRAVSEKRAYQLTYQMEHDMGNYGSLAPVDLLAEQYVGMAPHDVTAMYDDLIERRKAAGVDRKITAPLAALAITHLFGDKNQLVTDAEVVALEAAGLI